MKCGSCLDGRLTVWRCRPTILAIQPLVVSQGWRPAIPSYSAEVERRLKKAQRYLKSAEDDFAAGRFDISVTGAYFCAFHAVVAYLMDDGYSLADGGRWTHGYVQKSFAISLRDVEDRKLLRQMCLKLYQGRVVAEYQTTEIGRDDASHFLAFAHRIYDFAIGVVLGVAKPTAGATDNG